MLCAVRPIRELSLMSEGECKPHLSRANGIKTSIYSPNLLCFALMCELESHLCITEEGRLIF